MLVCHEAVLRQVMGDMTTPVGPPACQAETLQIESSAERPASGSLQLPAAWLAPACEQQCDLICNRHAQGSSAALPLTSNNPLALGTWLPSGPLPTVPQPIEHIHARLWT